jgi:hypothetical protein
LTEIKQVVKKTQLLAPAQGKVLVSAVNKEGKRTMTKSQERNKKRDLGDTMTLSHTELHN